MSKKKHKIDTMPICCVKYTDVNFDKIVFEEPIISNTSINSCNSSVRIKYLYKGCKEPQDFVVQFPELRSFFGLKYYYYNKKIRYSIELSLFNYLNSSKTEGKLFIFLNKFSFFIKKKDLKNKMSWFNHNFSPQKIKENIINNMYKNFIHVHENSKYAPGFDLKIPFVKGAFKTFVFDKNRKKLDLVESLSKRNILISSLVKFDYLWFSNKKFGCSSICNQIRIKIPNTYAFIDDDESDTDNDSSISEKM